MEPATRSLGEFAASAKRLARSLLTIGANRIELFMVEVQEQREHILHLLLLALGVAAFGLLAGITLTGAIVVWLWPVSKLGVFLGLTVLYGAAAALLYRRLNTMLRDWKNLPATLDQLRKDRECLEKNLP
jgi:uncharacterized membrane protein YqjE